MDFLGWLLAVVGFVIVVFGAGRIGLFFPKIKLPVVVGYIFVGIIAGPYICHLVPLESLKHLKFVTQFAMAFICYSAGAELYLPDIRELFKPILIICLGGLVTTTFLGFIPVMGMLEVGVMDLNLDPAIVSLSLQVGISLMIASVMYSFSPATAIAVVKETNSKGPFTSTFLGVTVVADVIVLVIFALSLGYTESIVSGEAFSIMSIVFLIVDIIFSIAVGWLLGKLIVLLLWIPRVPAYHLIMPLGYAVFALAQQFYDMSESAFKHALTIEPLLVCIIAGYVATNQSRHRIKFLQLLQKTATPLMTAFFTLTGLSLALNVLLKSLLFAVVLFIVRAILLFIGTAIGGAIAHAPKRHSLHMASSLITQSGVSLGLASKINITFMDSFGPALATGLIAAIVLNQLVGPITTKIALQSNGETRSAEQAAADASSDPNAPPKKLYVFGPTPVSIAIALRILRENIGVVVVSIEMPAGYEPIFPHLSAPQLPALFPSPPSTASDAPQPPTVEFRTLDMSRGGVAIDVALAKCIPEVTSKNTLAAIVTTDVDQLSYDICEYLRHDRSVKRVIACIHHPLWADRFALDGVLSVFPFSAQTHVIYNAIKAKEHGAVEYAAANKAMPRIFKTVVRDEDHGLELLHYSEEGRGAQLRRHRAPGSVNILQHLSNAIPRTMSKREDVADRDDYIDKLGLMTYEDADELEQEERLARDRLVGALASSMLPPENSWPISIATDNIAPEKYSRLPETPGPSRPVTPSNELDSHSPPGGLPRISLNR